MEIPLLAGRPLNGHDDARTPKVMVVNQTFANKYFPGENPIGKRLTFDPGKPDEIEIIGVAKDARYRRQRDEIPPTAYLSWRQGLSEMSEATLELRKAGDPSNLALNNIRTQIEQADRALATERLFARLMTLFGLLAQQLAAIGLFGVLAYSLSQRTREIGIRMALGADRRNLLKMILRQGMTLALLGVGLGLIGAYGLTKYLENQMNLSQMLYGVKVFDPLSYGVVAALLILVALVACFIPAQRTTKVDPLLAFRCD
jgi:predicted lysophospholipase L1 biosynthesis ABC-type transport system permease subunit